MEKDALLQLGLILLLRPAHGARHRDVGRAVENVLSVERALPECRPSFRVIVVHVHRVARRRRNVVLESTEIVKQLGHARSAVEVDCVTRTQG